MKTRVFNYVVCAVALFVAIALILGGGLWSLVGFAWCGLLYVSGVVWPRVWRSFWVSNMRILSLFGCL